MSAPLLGTTHYGYRKELDNQKCSLIRSQRSVVIQSPLPGGETVKLIDEYRRRALAVETLVPNALTPQEANELRKIARYWEQVARLRETYLKAHPDKST